MNKSLSVIVCCLNLLGCVANTVNSNHVVRHLDSLIGHKYDPAIGWDTGWDKIKEDDDSIEFEIKRMSGCSYAVTINKKTNSVASWRFTSPREKCDDNYAPRI